MKYFLGIVMLLTTLSAAFAQQFEVRNSKVAMPPASQPLYIIEGKVMPKLIPSKADSTKMVSPVAEINSGDIASIEILKSLSATAPYGDDGKNGVVKITLKKKANQLRQ
jgi:hypothetical protein